MRTGRRARRRRVNYDRYGYLFIAPFFIVFIVFQLYPIVFTFRTSLTDAVGWDRILNNSYVGFRNFKALFSDTQVAGLFWQSFRNTVVIWIFNFVPQIGFALLLASWFTDSHLHLKGQGAYKVMVFMPNIITAATIGMLFFSLFSYPIAPVNTLLQRLGILNAPFEFFRSVPASRGIISFIQWWMWYGNTMIILIAGMSGINRAIFESAMLDGCTGRQVFWKITLPLIRPILLYNLVTTLVGGLTMFDIPHLMTQGNPNNMTNTVARFIYQQGFTGSFNFNMASAGSIVLFGIIVSCSLVLSVLLNRRDARPLRQGGAHE